MGNGLITISITAIQLTQKESEKEYMNVRNLTTIVLTVLALAATAQAQEKQIETDLKKPAWRPTGYYSVSLVERYIAMRISRVLHDDISLWNELNVNLFDGVSLNFWEGHGLVGRSASKQPDELDLNLVYQKTFPNKLELRVATSYFNNYPLDRWVDGDVLVESVGLGRTYKIQDHTITPQLRLEWIGKTTDMGGGALIVIPNVTHVWQKPFGIKRLSFAQQLFAVRDDGFDGPKNDSDGIFARWNGGARWQLTKNLVWTMPGYSIQLPLTKTNDGRGEARAWSTSLTLKFQ